MNSLTNQTYHGERPLFASHNLNLQKIKILDGESAIKESTNLCCSDSYFNGKYPFWHVDNALIEKCTFDTNARAAIWYSSNLKMKNSKVIAPKMFRNVTNLELEQVCFEDAIETLWDCRQIKIHDCEFKNGDYLLQHSQDIEVNNLKLQGNYSFQNCTNIVIKNSTLDSKDALWEAKNAIVENCILDGEYLAWHSDGVRFINCKIKGTQPLCYAKNLELIDCTFDTDCDLAFEYSDVKANIKGDITSVKNPIHGFIRADKIHQIILDENQKTGSNCRIETNE